MCIRDREWRGDSDEHYRAHPADRRRRLVPGGRQLQDRARLVLQHQPRPGPPHRGLNRAVCGDQPLGDILIAILPVRPTGERAPCSILARPSVAFVGGEKSLPPMNSVPLHADSVVATRTPNCAASRRVREESTQVLLARPNDAFLEGQQSSSPDCSDPTPPPTPRAVAATTFAGSSSRVSSSRSSTPTPTSSLRTGNASRSSTPRCTTGCSARCWPHTPTRSAARPASPTHPRPGCHRRHVRRAHDCLKLGSNVKALATLGR